MKKVTSICGKISRWLVQSYSTRLDVYTWVLASYIVGADGGRTWKSWVAIGLMLSGFFTSGVLTYFNKRAEQNDVAQMIAKARANPGRPSVHVLQNGMKMSVIWGSAPKAED